MPLSSGSAAGTAERMDVVGLGADAITGVALLVGATPAAAGKGVGVSPPLQSIGVGEAAAGGGAARGVDRDAMAPLVRISGGVPPRHELSSSY